MKGQFMIFDLEDLKFYNLYKSVDFVLKLFLNVITCMNSLIFCHIVTLLTDHLEEKAPKWQNLQNIVIIKQIYVLKQNLHEIINETIYYVTTIS